MMINQPSDHRKKYPGFKNLSYFFISGSIAVLVILMLGISLTSLALYHPFLPGNPFFPLQEWCEETGAWVFAPGVPRAKYTLSIIEVRIDDLETRIGTQHEMAALEALGKAFDRAMEEIGHTTAPQNSELWAWLQTLAQRSESMLARLSEVSESNALAMELQTRLSILGSPDTDQSQIILDYDNMLELSNRLWADASGGVVATGVSSLPGGMIPFPPGSPGAVHGFYLLTGAHATLECTSCHTSGRYRGISSTCEGCHAEVKPDNHYNGGCVACHSPNSWQDVVFDHQMAGATDCRICHTKDAPANHYSGQCSSCHDTRGWAEAVFNHAGFTNCLQCHGGKAPANHYTGQCSQCHGTTSWRGAIFNHSGYTNCQNCHASKAPANHYSGQCSQCHSTTSWWGATFNHAGYTDCQRCHAAKAPDNHYSGQCSQCHSTTSWRGASFNHAGFTNCVGCHAGNAPSNHYSGQCSQCHSTTSWLGASFNHSGLTDCVRCHAGDAPANHFSGQCSQCHNQNTWRDASFNHSGQTDCISCHLKDRPDDHDPGQCSECHDTSRWND